MSDRIEDGGPAFARPMSQCWNAGGEPCAPDYGDPGMSLRDWFAGQALAAILTKDHVGGHYNLASVAYSHADAMLRARKGGEQ
jgi:hypothetical protein